MIWESIVFMLWMCVGTFQLIASRADLKGMSFFKERSWGYLFGVAMLIGSFWWFFATVELTEGGPKGQHDDQFLSFSLGISGALLGTWLLSSLIRRGSVREYENDVSADSGIEVFRGETFFGVLRRHLRRHNGEDCDPT